MACVDVDSYLIVNVYMPPPTRTTTTSILIFPTLYFCADDFNCHHADWRYQKKDEDGESLSSWAAVNSLSLPYNAKDRASFHSGR